MIKKSFIFFLFFIDTVVLFAQFPQQEEAFTCHCPAMNKPGKGTFYLSFGYNLDWFTKSDIHFKDNQSANYDFTLYNVSAEDRPGMSDLLHENLTVPQYSYRLGYLLNDKRDLGFEISYDHVKYVMTEQRVHLKGEINGEYFDKDTMAGETFIRYEHTNGANYFMLNAVKRLNFLHSKNELHWLSGMVRVGAGLVLPRTESYLWGLHRNDTYHVAGYVTGVDLGLRYDFLKHFYFETSGKGAFANYTNVFLYRTGRAHQHWFSFEYIFVVGYQFAI